MATTKIPKEIRDFIARYLLSVEYLEIFIVLQRNTTRSWSIPDIATEVRISESTAEQVLERLASDNFLDVKISNEILYRFNPATAALETAATRCADLYVRERIAMVNLVMACAPVPMHDCADASRIKKGIGDA